MTFNPDEYLWTIDDKHDELSKQRMEASLGREVTHKEWSDMIHIFFDWYDVGENGDEERQEQQRERRRLETKYMAYVLRDELDRVYWLHPYPSPTTERLKKIWGFAEYLYTNDDPAGFLGPSAGEMTYIFQAMTYDKKLTGTTEYDDLLMQLSDEGHTDVWFHDGWPILSSQHLKNPEFLAWLETDEYFHMFENRERRPDLIDYTEYDAFMKSRLPETDGVLTTAIHGIMGEQEQQEKQRRERAGK